jgi:hypothetical protein
VPPCGDLNRGSRSRLLCCCVWPCARLPPPLQIDFVCHDAVVYPDASGVSTTGDCYSHLRAMGKFWETQRTEVCGWGQGGGVQQGW